MLTWVTKTLGTKILEVFYKILLWKDYVMLDEPVAQCTSNQDNL